MTITIYQKLGKPSFHSSFCCIVRVHSKQFKVQDFLANVLLCVVLSTHDDSYGQ